MLHNLNLLLPVRWAGVFQLLTTATFVYSHSGKIAAEFRHPALRPGYSTLCRAITAWQAFLPRPHTDLAATSADHTHSADAAGTPSASWEAHEWCVAHPQEGVVLYTVVLGAWLPLVLVAALERLMKTQYLQQLAIETRRQRARAAAADAAASSGLGQEDVGLDEVAEDLDLGWQRALEGMEGALEAEADPPTGLWGVFWEVACIVALLSLTSLIDWMGDDTKAPSSSS